MPLVYILESFVYILSDIFGLRIHRIRNLTSRTAGNEVSKDVCDVPCGGRR